MWPDGRQSLQRPMSVVGNAKPSTTQAGLWTEAEVTIEMDGRSLRGTPLMTVTHGKAYCGSKGDGLW